jgi:hypothetical protein
MIDVRVRFGEFMNSRSIKTVRHLLSCLLLLYATTADFAATSYIDDDNDANAPVLRVEHKCVRDSSKLKDTDIVNKARTITAVFIHTFSNLDLLLSTGVAIHAPLPELSPSSAAIVAPLRC